VEPPAAGLGVPDLSADASRDMSLPMNMTRKRRILCCDCADAAMLSPAATHDIHQALADSGLGYDTVPDLCELAARKDPFLAELAGASVDNCRLPPARG
jgi:hypothetical protein